MEINFELKGKIRAKSIDDAINTLSMMQMDYDISQCRLEVEGSAKKDEPSFAVDIICKKK